MPRTDDLPVHGLNCSGFSRPRKVSAADFEALAWDCLAFASATSDPGESAHYFRMAERWSARAQVLAARQEGSFGSASEVTLFRRAVTEGT